MTGDTSQSDLEKGLNSYKSLSFRLLGGIEEEPSRLSVAVKNLTTVGVILEILHLDNGLKTESLKGREGLLTIVAQDDRIITEAPGKILWTRNREGEAEATLGLELLAPLPLPVRQMLEANMAINARDMKVLWDYWDEIQEISAPAALPKPVTNPVVSNHGEFPQEEVEIVRGDNRMYWVGFGSILCGLAMQIPQSEYLGFSGLIAMFLGSLLVAWKSIANMRQISSSGVD